MIDKLNPLKYKTKPWGVIYTFDNYCALLHVPNDVKMRMHGDKNTFYGVVFDDCDIVVEANSMVFQQLNTLIDSKASFRIKIVPCEGKSCYVGRIVNIMRSSIEDVLQKEGFNDIGYISPTSKILGSIILGRSILEDIPAEVQYKKCPVLEYEKSNPRLFRVGY